MPLDGTRIVEVDALWEGFERYLCMPYERNPKHLAEMQRWYKELRQSKTIGEDLRLAYVVVRNELTGQKFRAYRLNEQMFFSHQADVLGLPYPRSAHDSADKIFHDQYIGIYLHNFGYSEEFFGACRSRMLLRYGYWASEVRDLFNEQYKIYSRSVVRKLRNALSNKLLPGGRANRAYYWELRIAPHSQDDDFWHHDFGAKSEEMFWTRVIMHPLIGTGTEFALPGMNVSSPIGATSSHLAASRGNESDGGYWGPYHCPGDPSDGRVLLIKPDNGKTNDWEPIERNKKTPWKIKPLALAA